MSEILLKMAFNKSIMMLNRFPNGKNQIQGFESKFEDSKLASSVYHEEKKINFEMFKSKRKNTWGRPLFYLDFSLFNTCI